MLVIHLVFLLRAGIELLILSLYFLTYPLHPPIYTPCAFFFFDRKKILDPKTIKVQIVQ